MIFCGAKKALIESKQFQSGSRYSQPDNIMVWTQKILKRPSYSLLSLLFFALINGSFLQAADQVDREYVLKASFILKFSQFVQWPANSHSSNNPQKKLHLCLIGKDSFGNIFELAKKEAILERDLKISRLFKGQSKTNCHILFISGSEDGRLDQILRETTNRPILLVGDTPGFGRRGVGINFIVVKNKIRFEINREVIERTGIKINSGLLNIGKIINGRDLP